MNNKSDIANAMTIDVEDYFQVSAFEKVVSVDDWKDISPRVEKNTQRLLELFEKNNAKATFFVLGWVAERFPDLVKHIAASGHEVASHGYWHRRATEQTPQVFKDDVEKTRKMLQDLTGEPINGYRAPSFSFNTENEWVYDVLAEVGHQYSSSVYPVKHDLYGIPDAPRFKYKTSQGLWEIPLSTLNIAGKNIPISGGGYFRLYPYRFTAWAIKQFHRKDAESYIFYMHPWEIDPDQPRQAGLSKKSRFRHYLNLSRVNGRMERMLSDFNWSSMSDIYFSEK